MPSRGDDPGAGRAERSQATRDALVTAARRLFGARGYANVGTEEIVQAAGVTRGALYHHFRDKEELLEAVFEQVEAEMLARLTRSVTAAAADNPFAALSAGVDALLEAAGEPEVNRIVLVDAPSVLGWERWREIGWRYGMGLTESVLQAAIDAGQLPPQPVRPLAHVMLGALDEAVLYISRAPDQAIARSEMATVLGRLIDGLRA
jgi:AcrR family transcriptional regulator